MRQKKNIPLLRHMDSKSKSLGITRAELERELGIKASLAMLGKDAESLDPNSQGKRLGMLNAYLGGATCWAWLATKLGMDQAEIRLCVLQILNRDAVLINRSDTSGPLFCYHTVRRLTLGMICGAIAPNDAAEIRAKLRSANMSDLRSYYWGEFLTSLIIGDHGSSQQALRDYAACKGRPASPAEPLALANAIVAGDQGALTRELAKVEAAYDKLLNSGPGTEQSGRLQNMPTDTYWPWSSCALLGCASESARNHDSFWLPNSLIKMRAI